MNKMANNLKPAGQDPLLCTVFDRTVSLQVPSAHLIGSGEGIDKRKSFKSVNNVNAAIDSMGKIICFWTSTHLTKDNGTQNLIDVILFTLMINQQDMTSPTRFSAWSITNYSM